MNDIFKELIGEGVVVVYMDDILIFTESLEEHCKIVWCVLEIPRHNNLYLKPEKCLFEQLEVDYLGLILSQGQVATQWRLQVYETGQFLTMSQKSNHSLVSSTSTVAS